MKVDQQSLEHEVLTTFEEYLKIFFTERNYQKIISHIHHDVDGCGYNSDIALSYDDCLSIIARDIIQCPKAVPYQVRFLKIHLTGTKTAVIFAGLDVDYPLMKSLNTHQLRVSMVWTKIYQKWVVTHLHFSLASQDLTEGDQPIKELEIKNQQLEKLVAQRTKDLEAVADTDYLTGLYNRRKFNFILESELIRAERLNTTFSLIMGDLNHFKQINDEYGHLFGDEVLKSFGRFLKRNLPAGVVITRWGGDEFILLVRDADLDQMEETIRTIKKLLQDSNDQYQSMISISFGTAQYQMGDTVDSLLSRVDSSLYRAKKWQ